MNIIFKFLNNKLYRFIIRKNGAMTLINGHEGSISACYINNDGSLLVSCGYDKIIGLWDLVNGVPKLSLRVYN
jgi:WD40 repeat protein